MCVCLETHVLPHHFLDLIFPEGVFFPLQVGLGVQRQSSNNLEQGVVDQRKSGDEEGV